MAITDVVVDCLFEENLKGALTTLGMGRLIMDPEDPQEPYLMGDEEYLVVRVNVSDPYAFVRELEWRVPQMRIVAIRDRTSQKKDGGS